MLKIAVISGGPSSEHEISIQSGKQIVANLDRNKYEVKNIVISPEGVWQDGAKTIQPQELQDQDLLFIALHGSYGEDGTLQAKLDQLGFKYTGSAAAASQTAFNKDLANQVAATAGLDVPKSQLIKSNQINQPTILTIDFPLVVKPNRSGSSVGVSIVKDQSTLKTALQLAAQEDDEIMIQALITGREFSCGILADEPLPVVEIKPTSQFFDYESKYSDNGTQEICPAEMDEQTSAMIQQAALKIHQQLGCRGLTRSDFILTATDKLYYLETNTVPGMTEFSLCPKEARAAGLSYGEFLDRIIADAQTAAR